MLRRRMFRRCADRAVSSGMMRSVFVGLLIVMAIVLMLWHLYRPSSTSNAMKRFGRDPSAQRRMAELFRERDALLDSADSMPEDQIKHGVEVLLGSDDASRMEWCQVLEKVGARA